MDIFDQLAQKIIKQQETIIGPVAMEEAKKVPGIQVDPQKNEVTVTGDKKQTLEKLIEQYRDFFGMASVEVCRDAVRSLIGQVPKEEVPPLLLS